MRLIILITMMLTGWIAGTARGEELATVNGTAITTERFNQKLADLPPSSKDVINSPEGRREVLDILIARELLYQEAVKHRLEKDANVQVKLAEARRSVLVEAMMEKLLTPKVSGEALKTYYDAHRDEFREIRASHILVDKEADARSIRSLLASGADFDELARTRSKDARTGPTGGDLGYFTKGRMIPSVAAAAFKLPLKQISDPVKSSYGYHIIKVTDRREARRFEELPAPILDEVKRTILQTEIAILRSANKVTVNTEKLKAIR